MALWPQGGREYIHQRPGVPQLSHGLGVRMRPTFPWVRLPTALKPLGRPEFIPSGCDLQNLLPPSLGKSAKHSNLTGRGLGQGISIQNQMSSGSELSEAYSWLRYVPNRLRQRVLPTVAQGAFNPGPILVLLYAGKDDPLSLDSCLHAHYPRLSPYVVAFDTRRSPQPLGHDLLEDQPYGKLCQAAIEGRVRLVCGGPNCRTWSILRWFPKPNAPAPVRGRSEDLVWGLPTLTASEQEEVDGESLLILRQMFLTTLMKQNCSLPVASFLEHPRDPVECSSSPSASRCSSLWATKMFKAWHHTVGHTLVKFDQCRLGQLVPKATCLSSDLAIQCWAATILPTSFQKICNPLI